MKILQITVSTSHELSEVVSSSLVDFGSEGVSIIDPAEIKAFLSSGSWDYIDEKLLNDTSVTVLVSGFFDLDFNIMQIENELNLIKNRTDFETGSLEITSKIIDSLDWENVWKDYYKPIKIKDLTIVPLWLKDEDKSEMPVFINPGMAFGTGSHETTGMVIELLQQLTLKNLSVADVGCGSGILGICAMKLGCKSCDFIDIDINAIKATEENLAYNKCESKSRIRQESLLTSNDIMYDIILANLTVDLLKLLYPGLTESLKEKGKIIISGIIKERDLEAEQFYSKDYNVLEKRKNGEWCAMLLEKK